jgi:regulator of replication initiation timing
LELDDSRDRVKELEEELEAIKKALENKIEECRPHPIEIADLKTAL